ncbi:MAG: EAL domain-containing protein [Lachnospiraceae bacterium]|nr:EAL domain-containing protein [Lachnospiraceae bacterium]
MIILAGDDVIKHVENVHETMLNVFEGIHIEIKAGLYMLDDDCNEVGIACDHARIACNMIKRRYDKIYEIYEKDIHAKLKKQQYVLDNIDVAIEKQYIKVFYQPIIRVATGKICGYEALARWDDPKEGMLSPAEFIGTLEEYHMIHKVDIFILNIVCEDINNLMNEGKKIVPVSVNLSKLDFELLDIFTLTEQITQRYGLSRDMINIEITENALNSDSEHIKDGVKKFRDVGYHIWIDDFGSGYSSLNHFLDYDFDVLKLDLEFLRTFDKHPRAAELIRHIVYGATALGVLPLQEGVESQEHFDFLRSIKCERAQGYYFAKPMQLNDSREYTKSKGLEWE